MIISMRFALFLCSFCFFISCDTLDVAVFQKDEVSERESQIPDYDCASYYGAVNAVKKAHQLTDIRFNTKGDIEYNTGVIYSGMDCKGMIYSSVKELGTYVGSNVSFHTFLSAVNNPRSRLYTDHLNEAPYHGKNCKAYYGTVCSGLVSYALGLFPIMTSKDFAASPLMKEVDCSSPNNVHIADVLWKPGHVAIITDVIRDKNSNVLSVEISEAIQSGCRSYYLSRARFKSLMNTSFNKILRYNSLQNNTDYESQSQYVAVFGEKQLTYTINEDIGIDKGDQSCYFVGETVVVNLLSSFSYVDLYKDGVFLCSFDTKEIQDLSLPDLEYGIYQAFGRNYDYTSEPVSWIVVDCSISVSVEDECVILFSSRNSTPVCIHFCNIAGDRVYPYTELLCRLFNVEETSNGVISIPISELKKDCPYFVLGFSTEFGNAFTLPIRFMN